MGLSVHTKTSRKISGSVKSRVSYYLASLLLCVQLLVGPCSANAKEQAAHIHGSATLMFAIEKDVVDIQLESPAVNLLGFEHRAKTAAQKQRVEQTDAILQRPETLFLFAGSHCKPITTSVSSSETKQGNTDEHDAVHHSEYRDQHSGGEAHHHREHEHEHEHEHDTPEKHSEISASYRFRCDNTRSMKSITTTLFEHFSAIEKINAVWVTQTAQGTKTLSASDNLFSLK